MIEVSCVTLDCSDPNVVLRDPEGNEFCLGDEGAV